MPRDVEQLVDERRGALPAHDLSELDQGEEETVLLVVGVTWNSGSRSASDSPSTPGSSVRPSDVVCARQPVTARRAVWKAWRQVWRVKDDLVVLGQYHLSSFLPAGVGWVYQCPVEDRLLDARQTAGSTAG